MNSIKKVTQKVALKVALAEADVPDTSTSGVSDDKYVPGYKRRSFEHPTRVWTNAKWDVKHARVSKGSLFLFLRR